MRIIDWIINLFKPVPTPTPITDLSSVINELLLQHNSERLQERIPGLGESIILDKCAQQYASIMANLQAPSHTADGTTLSQRLAKIGYNYRYAGENIAYNYFDVKSIMAGWMNSPTHKANILNRNFTEVGFGLSYSSSKNANGSEPYWVAVFGNPSQIKSEAGRSISLSGPLQPNK